MGRLYLVGTPIGNLEDITLRALRILKEVSLIAAEDTRHCARLLNHFGIKTPMISYHQHSRPERVAEILCAVASGDVAVVSDAGMPGVSDPGFELVRQAIDAGVQIESVPGPSAVTTAAAMSGLVSGGFIFAGFPPRRQSERVDFFGAYRNARLPLILFEAPHRLPAMLSCALSAINDREIALCRELTKLHEEVIRTTLSEAIGRFDAVPPRGEYVVVIAPGEPSEPIVSPEEAESRLAEALADGASPADAARDIAAATGLPRRELYQLAVRMKKEVRE